MIALAYYLLKVTICSGILFIYYHAALRNKLFHQWNRFYLLSAVLLSLTIPVCQITIEHYFTEKSNSAIQLLQVVQSANGYFDEVTVSEHPGFSTTQWILTGYLFISFVLLVGLILSFLKIYKIVRTHPIQWIHKIKFLNTKVPGTPFSFFNYIFWNQKIDLKTETGQQILEHEMVHVRDRHTLDKLFMQLVLICFWFNPFFWLIRKELKLVHEFIADQKAVAQHGAAAFSTMILQAAFPEKFHAITNQFFQTSIKRRLAMLKKIQNPKINYLSRLCALPLIAFIVMAFTVRTKEISTLGSIMKPFTVVIDAGHGMMSNGQYNGAQFNGLSEDQIVLDLAKKIKELNNDKNLKVVLTRNSDAIIDLHDRVNISNANKADLFISLHMNIKPSDQQPGSYSEKSTSNGFEIYVSNKTPPSLKQSEIFGSILDQQLSGVYTINPALLKRNVGIWVLDKSNCPSVILECGFLDDDQDRNFITQKENQTIIASKILSAITHYANSDTSFISTPDERNSANETTPTATVSHTNKPADHPHSKDTAKQNPLLVIDGKEVGKWSEWKEKMNSDPGNIKSVTVLKDEKATKKYGEKGKEGVIEITLKDPAKPFIKDQSKPNRNQNATGKLMEQASQPGDKDASIDKDIWSKYLETHLMPVVSEMAKNGAKPGHYTVMLQLLINKEGKVVSVKALNDPGYGIAPKIVKIISSTSPNWQPALQKGVAVSSYHNQPVTLVISEANIHT